MSELGKQGPKEAAKRIVKEVLRFLNSRGGFDHWYEDMDASVQREIRRGLVSVVKAELSEGAAFPQVAPVPASNFEQEMDAEFAKLRKLEDRREALLSDAPTSSDTARALGLATLHPLMTAAQTERWRQVDQGATPEHDDQHDAEELAMAAACYALPDSQRYFGMIAGIPRFWPWVSGSWQPSPDDRRRELVKAASLLMAEWDRLDRLEAKG